jgi:hypothetical protein
MIAVSHLVLSSSVQSREPYLCSRIARISVSPDGSNYLAARLPAVQHFSTFTNPSPNDYDSAFPVRRPRPADLRQLAHSTTSHKRGLTAA